MFKRILNLAPILEDRSIFLLGPRQTGKTTYLKAAYHEAHYIDLLDSSYFRTVLFNSALRPINDITIFLCKMIFCILQRNLDIRARDGFESPT